MEGQGPYAFHPANSFGFYEPRPFANAPHSPQVDPVARKRERDMFPTVPEETIINGQAIKKLRINPPRTSTPPGHGVLAPPSPTAMSTPETHLAGAPTPPASSIGSDHDDYGLLTEQQQQATAHNPNEGPCGDGPLLDGPLPPLCRSYSEPTKRTTDSPLPTYHDHFSGVDDTDVNYSIINQMLRILHFERVSRDSPQDPDSMMTMNS